MSAMVLDSWLLDRQTRDSSGNRLIKCLSCGKISVSSDFWFYQWSRGECTDCGRKRM